ncbi:MAG: hypothetical protein ABI325_03970 [Ginsengibacter sp.]
MLLAPTPKVVKRDSKQTQIPVTTLGLTFRFQPSMQDNHDIQTTLAYIIKAVEAELKRKYNNVFRESILGKLNRIFSRLNYNTNKISVAILVGPNGDRIIYLDFFTNPLIYFNKHISIFDLVGNTNNQPEFFLLFSGNRKSMLFEYYNGKLNKEYETEERGFISNTSIHQNVLEKSEREVRNQQILNVIKLMNPKKTKPVFLTGNEEQINRLYNAAPFREIMFKKMSTFSNGNKDNLKLLASETRDEWRHWHCKFLAGKIELAKQSNRLIGTISDVTKALKNSKDGLLLIDKYYRKQLMKSLRGSHSLGHSGRVWMSYLERFLSRGNHIEIIKTGVLKDYGGILLIENELMSGSDRIHLAINKDRKKNNALLF